MKRKPLFWKLFPTFLTIIILSLLPFVVISGVFVYKFYKSATVEVLDSKIDILRERLNLSSGVELQSLVRSLEDIYIVYDKDLKPVAASNLKIADLEITSPGEDVVLALKNGRAIFEGYQYGLSAKYIYLSKKTEVRGEEYIIRGAFSLSKIQAELYELLGNILISLLILALALSLGAWVLSLKISRPLVSIKKHAEKIANSDMFKKIRLPQSISSETYSVAEAINTMSEQLHRRMKQILRQKNELDALFASMGEGVLAVTKEAKVLHINQEAIKNLGIDFKNLEGLRMDQLIRNVEIQDFVKQAIQEVGSVEREFLLAENQSLLSFKSSSLLSASGKNSGAVIVINDITRIRKLEKQRQEFVANVSHELRTPLTLIQGFTETIQNPNVTDVKEIKKFVGIVDKHAKRLQQIIEDLLRLSKLDSQKDIVDLELGSVNQVIESAIDLCQMKAKQKNVQLNTEIQNGLQAYINPILLEQAVINLIDNGIKYSPNGESIDIIVKCDQSEICISVKDNGPGIPPEHHGRLFERFYRVDKARSRNLGGTGLGLSIVKHIALAHKGRVLLESDVGKGSKFLIFFPLP